MHSLVWLNRIARNVWSDQFGRVIIGWRRSGLSGILAGEDLVSQVFWLEKIWYPRYYWLEKIWYPRYYRVEDLVFC